MAVKETVNVSQDSWCTTFIVIDRSDKSCHAAQIKSELAMNEKFGAKIYPLSIAFMRHLLIEDTFLQRLILQVRRQNSSIRILLESKSTS